MRSLRTILLATVAGGLLASQPGVAATPAAAPGYKHVLLISVDGLHAADLTNWVESHPKGAFGRLVGHGIVYPNAFTSAPSDSFPGMLAQATGASPKYTGMYYDDSYDRETWAAGSNCVGAPGAEITNFEALDYNLDDVSAGGTLGQPLTQINPANLQMQIVDGTCQPVYPHQYLRVNTIFEVIKAAGMPTAWSDKHPAYEILDGPSGKGIDDLFTPEINSQMFLAGAPAGKDNTTSYAAVRAYDSLKVAAVVNWIDGWNSTHTAKPGTPAIFGMNFQAVSIGQKLAKAGYGDAADLTGGYLDSNATPGNALTLQLSFVDAAIGKMLRELNSQDLSGSTLVIVSAKHAQSPIDPKARVAVDDAPYAGTPGYAFHVADDEALVWLAPGSQKTDYAAARDYLKANAATLGIAEILDRTSLATLYQDPFHDSRTPDFVTVVNHGVIYTGGTKLAEHGGFADDDRNVALVVSAADIKAKIVEDLSYTTQIAPTILTALGLDPTQLQGVQLEGTRALTR